MTVDEITALLLPPPLWEAILVAHTQKSGDIESDLAVKTILTGC